jgi:hypothetical protein
MMVDPVFPQRTAQLRASTTQEIKATAVAGMEIETASGRIRFCILPARPQAADDGGP